MQTTQNQVKADHEKRVADLREANAKSEGAQLRAQPTPSQEENDLMALGLMHIDDKTSGDVPQDKRAAAESRAPAHEPARAVPREH